MQRPRLGPSGIAPCWRFVRFAAAASALATPLAMHAQPADCPAERETVYLMMDDSQPEPRLEIAPRIAEAVSHDNRIVLLRSDVVADFTQMGHDDSPLLPFARCVTLGSYAQDGERIVPGRDSRRAGPTLLFGNPGSHGGGVSFLDINCERSSGRDGNGARITGLRIQGPTRDDQQASNTGIEIAVCRDVEISNTEVFGWGNAAIDVIDRGAALDPKTGVPVAAREDWRIWIHDSFLHHNQHSTDSGHAAGYGVSVGTGAFARIERNAFDFNRHSITSSGDAGGYDASDNLILKGGGYHGAWYERNIHVVDAHGQTGYFDFPGDPFDYFVGAVLLGLGFGSLFGPWGALIGGVSGVLVGLLLWLWVVPSNNTSYVDGYAGLHFDIQRNTFQYKKTLDVKIRGTPADVARIDGNVFVRSDVDAAINPTDNPHVKIGPANRYDVDTFATWQVCDFDGDGVDDLFLATGVGWWFASRGRREWIYLRADSTPPAALKVGYFDGDNRCDVITQHEPDEWVISSGGTGDWQGLGGATRHLHFGHRVGEVQFGRFDPAVRDQRPHATRQTTHAFWRRPDGQWFVTPLTAPAWHPVASSSIPVSDLRFGDFNGDGVTDVLSNAGQHWSVSDSAIDPWRTLNATLNDPVRQLFIGNMDDDDNIDDLLRLDTSVTVTGGSLFHPGTVVYHFKWWRSRNGTDAWRLWRDYDMPATQDGADLVPPGWAATGRFGEAGGGATLLVDTTRLGRFFGRGSTHIPHDVDWLSGNAY